MNFTVTATLSEDLGHYESGQTFVLADSPVGSISELFLKPLDGKSAEATVTASFTGGELELDVAITDDVPFLPSSYELPKLVEPVGGIVAEILTAIVGETPPTAKATVTFALAAAPLVAEPAAS